MFIQNTNYEKLPSSILLNYADSNYRIFLSNDTVICFLCSTLGHVASNCPINNNELIATNIDTKIFGINSIATSNSKTPILDYGSIGYSLAHSSPFKTLDIINNSGIRLAIGEMGIIFTNMLSKEELSTPLWANAHLHIRLNLAENLKQSIPPETFRHIFKELSVSLAQHKIYTDATKNSGTTIAIVNEPHIFSFKTPETTSIYTAENLALYKATLIATTIDNSAVTICSNF